MWWFENASLMRHNTLAVIQLIINLLLDSPTNRCGCQCTSYSVDRTGNVYNLNATTGVQGMDGNLYWPLALTDADGTKYQACS